MFTVFNKKTMEEAKVYDVQLDNCGYPKFLIKQNGQWLYRSAKHYITEDEHKKIMELEKNSKLIPCAHNHIEVCRQIAPPYYNTEIKYRCTKCGHTHWV